MFTRGHAKHPCVQSTDLRGLAVGAIRRYRCGLMRLQEAPLYTVVFESTPYNAVITMGFARVVSKSRFKSIDSNVA
jgi:hypothetical protein